MLENKITFRPSVDEQIRLRVEQDRRISVLQDHASKLRAERELRLFEANVGKSNWHPSYGYAIALVIVLSIVLILF